MLSSCFPCLKNETGDTHRWYKYRRSVTWVCDCVISYVEFVLSQVSKSRPGAPIFVQDQAVGDLARGCEAFDLDGFKGSQDLRGQLAYTACAQGEDQVAFSGAAG